jgi:hypothetical protein
MEAACDVLTSIDSDCLAELAAEAAAEEQASGQAVTAGYEAVLKHCGIPLPTSQTGPRTKDTHTAAQPTKKAAQPAAAAQAKPGCSVTDVEDCYQYADDRNAVEECLQRNDERVRCCKSLTTSAC